MPITVGFNTGMRVFIDVGEKTASHRGRVRCVESGGVGGRNRDGAWYFCHKFVRVTILVRLIDEIDGRGGSGMGRGVVWVGVIHCYCCFIGGGGVNLPRLCVCVNVG